MQTPREILEAAMREPTDLSQARATFRAVLDALPALEADAARWRGFRRAATQQDERFVEAMSAYPMADEAHPTDAEIDAAADEGIKAMTP